MPSSDSKNIPVVLHVAWTLCPERVLDVGAGYGKYGVLFREYLELRRAAKMGYVLQKENTHKRTIRIDAVEPFTAYIGPVHRAVYDEIYETDLCGFLEQEWQYDLIFLGDVLEHIDKETATNKILPALVKRAVMGLLVAVPAIFREQGAVFDNPLESHRSEWSIPELRQMAPYVHAGYTGSHLFGFLTRNHTTFCQVRGSPVRKFLRRIKSAFVDSF